MDIKSSIDRIGLVMDRFDQDGGFSDQIEIEWPKNIPCSNDLEIFYKCISSNETTSIEIGSSILFFIRLDALVKSHAGYKVSSSGVPNPDWGEGYVLFALYNDEPLVVDTNSDLSPVFGAFESGPFINIAVSLTDFINAVAALVELQHGEFSSEIINDDYEISSAFIDRAKYILSENKGVDVDAFISFFFD
ncbi:hypothetical protein [Oceanospirillum beijerinckii]|uniref:hypothetical protein n=1 Tax=Oceanospirillum beijerinckii TaxID=64976 RepID=UPI00048A0679|nr:hypothetical protein [Oceanospirillum beijerinckii]